MRMKYNTGKKEAITALLKNNSLKSFSLVEICDAIAQDGKGQSTVYRLVSELVEAGAVRKISDEKTRHCTYQYVGGAECKSHLHLKCRECGRLIHLEKALSSKLLSEVYDAGGFLIESGCMLFGKCRECTA